MSRIRYFYKSHNKIHFGGLFALKQWISSSLKHDTVPRVNNFVLFLCKEPPKTYCIMGMGKKRIHVSAVLSSDPELSRIGSKKYCSSPAINLRVLTTKKAEYYVETYTITEDFSENIVRETQLLACVVHNDVTTWRQTFLFWK